MESFGETKNFIYDKTAIKGFVATKCWINDEEQTISLHPINGYTMKKFPTSNDCLLFILTTIETQQYRIQ